MSHTIELLTLFGGIIETLGGITKTLTGMCNKVECHTLHRTVNVIWWYSSDIRWYN